MLKVRVMGILRQAQDERETKAEIPPLLEGRVRISGGCHRNPEDEKFPQNLPQNPLTASGRTLYNISRYIEIILDIS